MLSQSSLQRARASAAWNHVTTVRFEGRPNAISYVHVDFPLRPYPVDVNDRRVWGKAGPVARWLIGPKNPPLKKDSDPVLRKAFESLDKRPLPEQVKPRWKLGKMKDQRKPEAWDPERRCDRANLPS